MRRSTVAQTALVIVFLAAAIAGTPRASHAYSVLSHEPVVDLVWDDHLKPMLLNPTLNRAKFIYRVNQAQYERDWGKKYRKPGIGARVLAAVASVASIVRSSPDSSLAPRA